MPWLKRVVTRLLRLPREPRPPAVGSVQVFRAARNYFRYKLAGWGFQQAGVLVGVMFALGPEVMLQESQIRMSVESVENLRDRVPGAASIDDVVT